MDKNSNKCVNIQNEEIHEYVLRDVKFIVRTINKNENPEVVFSRLKSVIVNHADTKS